MAVAGFLSLSEWSLTKLFFLSFNSSSSSSSSSSSYYYYYFIIIIIIIITSPKAFLNVKNQIVIASVFGLQEGRKCFI